MFLVLDRQLREEEIRKVERFFRPAPIHVPSPALAWGSASADDSEFADVSTATSLRRMPYEILRTLQPRILAFDYYRKLPGVALAELLTQKARLVAGPAFAIGEEMNRRLRFFQ